MLKDLSGIGSLQDALATTNSLLADVLAELKETNSQRLELIAKELRTLHETGALADPRADQIRPSDG
jgi:hypothetical protein